MASAALHRWQTLRAAELDRIAAAHSAVGGKGRGRRWATQQINQAYAVLLCSQFQGFCRDLHTECVHHVAKHTNPATLERILRAEFVLARRLDRGNPNSGNIGSDFARFGLAFWDEVRADNGRAAVRQKRIDDMSLWRNAIAHQDFDPRQLRPSVLTLEAIRGWRRACTGLSLCFDRVIARHIASITGEPPW